MLNAVILFSLRFRALIVGISLAVLVYGGCVAMQMPIDVLPDLDRPRVVIMTECAGLAAEEVETLVSYPLESAFLGATGVQTVRSESGPSLSMVTVEFDWGTNIYTARQIAQERLSAVASSLPEDARPQLAPITSVMGQILYVGLSRKPGPRGGALAAIGRTVYLAELVVGRDSADGGRPLDLYLWNPRDERGRRLADPDLWKPLHADRVQLMQGPAASGILLKPSSATAPVSHFRGFEPNATGVPDRAVSW